MRGYMWKWKELRFLGTAVIALLFLCLAVQAWTQSSSQPPDQSKPGRGKAPKKEVQDQPFVLVGAGDIASCKDPQGARATAQLIEQIPGTVFAAGDLAYEHGSAEDFKNCYSPTWGRFKNRTRPALGNHEYGEPAASSYFQYWGSQGGPAGRGYYSYDLGAWHIVVLNTNCGAKGLGGCAKDSPQETWLKDDLANHPNTCILTYGHHPLFSSGVFKKHALHPELKQLWGDLYAVHADLILAGHEHSYERFAPQDPDGKPDLENGIREIVVGTGGRSHDMLGLPMANSEVQNWDTFGVLKLTLSTGKYTWEFIPEEGKTFHDSGGGVCHNRPAAAN